MPPRMEGSLADQLKNLRPSIGDVAAVSVGRNGVSPEQLPKKNGKGVNGHDVHVRVTSSRELVPDTFPPLIDLNEGRRAAEEKEKEERGQRERAIREKIAALASLTERIQTLFDDMQTFVAASELKTEPTITVHVEGEQMPQETAIRSLMQELYDEAQKLAEEYQESSAAEGLEKYDQVLQRFQTIRDEMAELYQAFLSEAERELSQRKGVSAAGGSLTGSGSSTPSGMGSEDSSNRASGSGGIPPSGDGPTPEQRKKHPLEENIDTLEAKVVEWKTISQELSRLIGKSGYTRFLELAGAKAMVVEKNELSNIRTRMADHRQAIETGAEIAAEAEGWYQSHMDQVQQMIDVAKALRDQTIEAQNPPVEDPAPAGGAENEPEEPIRFADVDRDELMAEFRGRTNRDKIKRLQKANSVLRHMTGEVIRLGGFKALKEAVSTLSGKDLIQKAKREEQEQQFNAAWEENNVTNTFPKDFEPEVIFSDYHDVLVATEAVLERLRTNPSGEHDPKTDLAAAGVELEMVLGERWRELRGKSEAMIATVEALLHQWEEANQKLQQFPDDGRLWAELKSGGFAPQKSEQIMALTEGIEGSTSRLAEIRKGLEKSPELNKGDAGFLTASFHGYSQLIAAAEAILREREKEVVVIAAEQAQREEVERERAKRDMPEAKLTQAAELVKQWDTLCEGLEVRQVRKAIREKHTPETELPSVVQISSWLKEHQDPKLWSGRRGNQNRARLNAYLRDLRGMVRDGEEVVVKLRAAKEAEERSDVSTPFERKDEQAREREVIAFIENRQRGILARLNELTSAAELNEFLKTQTEPIDAAVVLDDVFREYLKKRSIVDDAAVQRVYERARALQDEIIAAYTAVREKFPRWDRDGLLRYIADGKAIILTSPDGKTKEVYRRSGGLFFSPEEKGKEPVAIPIDGILAKLNDPREPWIFSRRRLIDLEKSEEEIYAEERSLRLPQVGETLYYASENDWDIAVHCQAPDTYVYASVDDFDDRLGRPAPYSAPMNREAMWKKLEVEEWQVVGKTTQVPRRKKAQLSSSDRVTAEVTEAGFSEKLTRVKELVQRWGALGAEFSFRALKDAIKEDGQGGISYTRGVQDWFTTKPEAKDWQGKDRADLVERMLPDMEALLVRAETAATKLRAEAEKGKGGVIAGASRKNETVVQITTWENADPRQKEVFVRLLSTKEKDGYRKILGQQLAQLGVTDPVKKNQLGKKAFENYMPKRIHQLATESKLALNDEEVETLMVDLRKEFLVP